MGERVQGKQPDRERESDGSPKEKVEEGGKTDERGGEMTTAARKDSSNE